jgi:hypothetical protein
MATELTYDEFVKQYTEAFKNCMKYNPNQVGSQIYTEKMVQLADDYPDFLETFEAYCEENKI